MPSKDGGRGGRWADTSGAGGKQRKKENKAAKIKLEERWMKGF